ncbi:MAG: universal stress protein [Timaviella obliquedivisa GSE-PSE-MK23-08B]|jgi:nucleotide-binding universal stress UspA family protein|nr:universal stress protein [Timaviella obliquedivisa GSE-PSE-MK23-08B]
MSFQKVLVALDRSLQASAVFEQAMSEVKARGKGSLMLVHALRMDAELPTGSFMGLGTIADLDTYGILRRVQQEKIQQERDKAIAWLQPYQQQAIAQGIVTELTCLVGTPGAGICELAQSWGADLIVLGRRGHQGLTEVMMGSVSNYVVHHAPCSVLVVQRAIEMSEAKSLEPAS